LYNFSKILFSSLEQDTPIFLVISYRLIVYVTPFSHNNLLQLCMSSSDKELHRLWIAKLVCFNMVALLLSKCLNDWNINSFIAHIRYMLSIIFVSFNNLKLIRVGSLIWMLAYSNLSMIELLHQFVWVCLRSNNFAKTLFRSKEILTILYILPILSCFLEILF